MDPVQTVGGAEGLSRIADIMRREGFQIHGAYLINRRSNDDIDDWVVAFVTSARPRDLIYRMARLRRDGAFPEMSGIRIDTVKPDNPEAVGVVSYARRFDRLPVEIDGVLLDGLLVTYALVADIRDADLAAA